MGTHLQASTGTASLVARAVTAGQMVHLTLDNSKMEKNTEKANLRKAKAINKLSM